MTQQQLYNNLIQSVQNDLKEIADYLDKYEKLYHSINHMMASLGCHGEIDTRNQLVIDVMNDLRDIDGGVYLQGNDHKGRRDV